MFDGTSQFKTTLIRVSVLQHFSRYDNSAKGDWIYLSEWRLISIAPPPSLPAHNFMFDPMSVWPCLFLSPFFPAVEKMQVISLDHVAGLKLQGTAK